MRALVVAVTTAIALALGRADAATATLATDGFALDGKTTYCEGVREAKAPLQFNQELATSAGKCPIALEMTATLRNTANSNAVEVWVDWSASLASGDVAQSLFPRAVDATSGSPKPIIASLVRACKSGSNCATDADVVVPAAVQSNVTTTGPFDDDNHKALRGFVFGFPSGQVDHIVIAKIVLPGDPQLNISATEFITFQRVESPGAATVPATVKPYEPTHTNQTVMSGPPVLTPMPSHLSRINVNATGTDNGLGASTPTTGKQTNIILLSAIGGLACVVAIAYFALAKREKRSAPTATDGHDVNASVYRLTDAANEAPSVQFSLRHQHRQARAKTWAAPQSTNSVVEHKSEAVSQPRMAPVTPALSIGSYNDLTRRQMLMHDSRVSSAHSSFDGSMIVSDTMSFSSLHTSEVGNLYRLGDNPMEPPVTSQRHRSTSTFTTLDELEHDLSFEENEPRSSASDNDLLTTESRLAWSESALSDMSDHEGCDVDLLTTESRLSWLSDMSDHEA